MKLMYVYFMKISVAMLGNKKPETNFYRRWLKRTEIINCISYRYNRTLWNDSVKATVGLAVQLNGNTHFDWWHGTIYIYIYRKIKEITVSQHRVSLGRVLNSQLFPKRNMDKNSPILVPRAFAPFPFCRQFTVLSLVSNLLLHFLKLPS